MKEKESHAHRSDEPPFFLFLTDVNFRMAQHHQCEKINLYVCPRAELKGSLIKNPSEDE